MVGQRLLDLGAFTEIQGGTSFVISGTAYYQFSISSSPMRAKENSQRFNKDAEVQYDLRFFLIFIEEKFPKVWGVFLSHFHIHHIPQ